MKNTNMIALLMLLLICGTILGLMMIICQTVTYCMTGSVW